MTIMALGRFDLVSEQEKPISTKNHYVFNLAWRRERSPPPSE
jgi:hypothetical protein